MHLYRARLHQKSAARIAEKLIETVAKAFVLFLYPVVPSAFFSFVWYYGLYKNGIHIDAGSMEIAVTAWISTFGILYGLFAAEILSTVWSEYKNTRMAIKDYDLDLFMKLRDEDVSPVVHAMLALFSSAVLAAFMVLQYPNPVSGLICVASTSYLFAFVFFVIMEIDDPLEGVWFIKHVHDGWLELDVKTWRTERYARLKADRDGQLLQREESAEDTANPAQILSQIGK